MTKLSTIDDCEMSIKDFIDAYSYDADPIFELARVATQYYVKENIGQMTANEIVSHLSQHGDTFEYHVRKIFDIDD